MIQPKHNIKQHAGRNVFISSDWHLGQKNIVAGISDWKDTTPDELRDFRSIYDMDETIIGNINSQADVNDVIYFLGDFSFGGLDNIFKYRSYIRCKNIHVILGNHDHHFYKPQVQAVFSSVHHYLEVIKGKDSFVSLSHFPMYSWSNMGAGYPHFHGHLHNKGDARFLGGRSLDVGLDGNDFMMYKFNDALDMVMSIDVINKMNDHHTKERK